MTGFSPVILAFFLLQLPLPTPAYLCRLSNVHGNNMVLQRAPQQTTLFGFATPSTTITTLFRGTNLTTMSNDSGEWRQILPATPASTPSGGGENITFSCSTGEVFALESILWGEVVICGGQR